MGSSEAAFESNLRFHYKAALYYKLREVNPIIVLSGALHCYTVTLLHRYTVTLLLVILLPSSHHHTLARSGEPQGRHAQPSSHPRLRRASCE